MRYHNLLLLVFLGVLVLAGLMAYGDVSQVISSVSAFPPHYWIMALALAGVNYLLRFARWSYYLRLLGIKVGVRTSALVFFSGLTMTISPGRVGELAKSYFLKERADTPVSRSAPAVISERLMDVASVLLLGIWGLAFIPYGWAVIGVVLTGLIGFMAVLGSPWGVALLCRLPLFRRWSPFIDTSGDAFRTVLSPQGITVGLALGGLAWLSEGLAFWLVLQGFGSVIVVPLAVSMYCAASLLGAVSMLPGGLVSTEGGMLALLRGVGVGSVTASSATLVTRVCTLWFAVALGAAIFVVLQRTRRKRASVGEEAEGSETAYSELAGGDGN